MGPSDAQGGEMNIVQPSVKIISLNGQKPNRGVGIDGLRFIEWCARISHASEGAQTENSWERFIEFVVMTKGDWSVTEHISATVDFLVDRGVTHELVRHRLFSFTQSSTRFINYSKKMPPAFIEPEGLTATQRGAWSLGIEQAEEQYREIIAQGGSPQVARSVLPNALASRIIVTGNLRNWRHALIMRTTKEAHPDFKRMMIILLRNFQQLVPILFDDIEVDLQQSQALKKAK
jgi:thymidylate synthase (FAD)